LNEKVNIDLTTTNYYICYEVQVSLSQLAGTLHNIRRVVVWTSDTLLINSKNVNF